MFDLNVIWPRKWYFESARALISIHLRMVLVLRRRSPERHGPVLPPTCSISRYISRRQTYDKIIMHTRFLSSKRGQGEGRSGGHHTSTPNSIPRVQLTRLCITQRKMFGSPIHERSTTRGLKREVPCRSARHVQMYVDLTHPLQEAAVVRMSESSH